MVQTFRNAWKIPELRRKILFTLFVLMIYRLGACVPVPYVNVSELATYFSQQLSGTVLGLYNAMSGSAFSQATVFAIGIQPYINASIIIELLAIAIPALERLAKEGGEEGQKKIQRITRYTTVGLALLMGFAYYVMLKNYNLLNETGFLAGLVIVVTFMAGASFLMWMGEQIDQFGIGNGISMILFAGIISRIPSLVSALVSSLASGAIKWYTAILLVLGMLLIVVFIVFITNSERRVPVQYAKRVVGRKMYGGQSTFLPVKVNMSGVLPIIFAQSIATLPATIIAFTGTGSSSFWTWMNTYIFDTRSAFYIVCYFLLIIAFSYFYATIQFNPIEIANNLKKNGGFIPGFRPGKPTSDFILKVINKITLFGALYLAIVAILPIIAGGTQFIQAKFLMLQMPSTDSSSKGSSAMMLYFMPIMSIWICFVMPAAMGIYWIANSVFGIIRDYTLTKVYKKKLDEEDKIRQAARSAREKELEAKRLETERLRAEGKTEKNVNTSKKKIQASEKQKSDERKAALDKAERAARRERLGIKENEKPASQVGNRRYARGRAYVEDRFVNPEAAEEATIAAAAESEGAASIDETVAEEVLVSEDTALQAEQNTEAEAEAAVEETPAEEPAEDKEE